jgi:uncharacterized alkaline shock family protein YloU
MAEIVTSENNGFLGKVSIADEVIATIAGTAAMEIDGVAYMAAGNISDIAELLGKKNFSKGVKLEVNGNAATVEVHIYIKNGYKIPDVSQKVQERVKTAVETMTGLDVLEVNVHISGLSTDKPTGKKDSRADN